MILTMTKRMDTELPAMYMIALFSANSSNAEVIITAVRTYFAMSIRKSATFSQIDAFFTIPFPMSPKIFCSKVFGLWGKTKRKSVVFHVREEKQHNNFFFLFKFIGQYVTTV